MNERKYINIFLFAFLVSLTLLFGRIITDQITIKQDATSNSQAVWPAFDGGGDRNGINTFESVITIQNVSHLTKLWSSSLPDNSRGSLAALSGVTTGNGIKDLVFLTTRHGQVVAYDTTSGNQIWKSNTPQGNYVAGQGTTSSPAIDPSNQFIYSYGLDGAIHKYDVGSGKEETTGGFPATVSTRTDVEKGSSPINVGNGYLYMTMSGYDGDFGPYVGHIVGINLSTGTKTIFNVLCSNVHSIINGNCQYNPQNSGAGVWGRGGGVIDPLTKNVFISSGNGLYDGTGNNYGDSIIELSPDLSNIIDSYTPGSYNSLQQSDTDLGSTSPVMIPQQQGTNTPNLLIQGGKDGSIRLLNRSNLSGKGGPNHTGGELHTYSVNNEVLSQPATWTDSTGQSWVYITNQSGTLYGFKVVNSGGTSSLTQGFNPVSGAGHTSPLIANGVLFLQGNSKIAAYNPTTGQQLWSSTIGSDYWESPIVFNGEVFTLDDTNTITAFGIPGGGTPSLTPTITNQPDPTPTSPQSTDTPIPTQTLNPTQTDTPTPTPLYYCGNPCSTNAQCNANVSGGCGFCDQDTHTCAALASQSPTPTNTVSFTPVPQNSDTPTQIPPTNGITNTPTPTSSSPTPTAGPATGSIAVHFEGIDPQNNPKPHSPQRQIILSFYKTQNFANYPDELISIRVSFDPSDPNGSFVNKNIAFLAIPPGSYYILVKSPEGSLREEVSSQPIQIVPGTTISLNGQSGPVNLRIGDLNNDNSIDLTDYNIFIDCFGKKMNGPACKKHGLSDFAKGLFADLNDDGEVNGVDYNLLLRNFGESGY